VAAAEVALALFAVDDAREHLVRARSLLDEGASGAPGRLGTASERLALYGGLGRVHEVMREWAEALGAYERMLEEARRADDREAEWATLHRLAALGIDEGSVTRAEHGGEFHRELHRTRNHGSEQGDRRDGRSPGPGTSESFAWSLSTARGRETEALGLARAMHRDDLVVQSLAALGVLEAHSGRWERALSAAEEGIAVCSRTGDKATEGELLGLVARSLTMTGEARTAARRMRYHPGLTGALGDREIHRADVFNMAIALTETGDYEDALAMAREGVAAARSVGYAPRLMLNLLALGDTSRTLFHLREAGDVYREMAGVIFPPEYRALVHAKLCAVAALAADWRTAYDEAASAAGLRDEVPVQSTAALHFHLEVEALLHGGDQDLARDQLARFGAATGENRRLRLAHQRALAVLGRHDGDETAALAHLQAARGLAEEIGLPGELWQVEALTGAIQAGLGNEAEAQRSRARAAAIVNRLAAGIRNRALRLRYVSATAVHRESYGTPSR
jgi:tetratricopeptide (TPR) repeat protein